jgi:hypothetical protein
LAALYAVKPAAGRKPASDDVEIIDPPPAFRIGAIEYLMPKKTARVKILKVLSQSSPVTSSSRPVAPPTPALLNVISRRPNSRTARSIIDLISFSLVTSVR